MRKPTSAARGSPTSHHAIPDRVARSLDAVADLELREDVRDVIANRVRADEELLRDLGVVLSACEQLQDLDLALGQLAVNTPFGRCAAIVSSQALEELCPDRG